MDRMPRYPTRCCRRSFLTLRIWQLSLVSPGATAGWQYLSQLMADAGTAARDVCENDGRRGHIIGLALLSGPTMFNSILQRLDMEQRFLVELASSESGMLLKVEDILVCAEPILARHESAELAPHCSIFGLSPAGVQEALGLVVENGTTMRQACVSWLGRVGLMPADVLQVNTCIQLWGPIAFGIALKAWRSIFVSDSLRVAAATSINEWFVLNGRTARRSQACFQWKGVAADLDSDRLRWLADHFRCLAGHMLGTGPAIVDIEEEQMALEADVAFLEETAATMALVGTQVMEGFGRFGSQRRFRLESLLTLFLYSQLARGKRRLRDLVVKPFRILLPGNVYKHLVEKAMGLDCLPQCLMGEPFRYYVDRSPTISECFG